MRFLIILLLVMMLSVSLAGAASVPTSEAEKLHEAEKLAGSYSQG